MHRPISDAIVFFGATGDLAYKQIFPALQGLVRDEGSMCRSSALPRRMVTRPIKGARQGQPFQSWQPRHQSVCQAHQSAPLCRRRLQ